MNVELKKILISKLHPRKKVHRSMKNFYEKSENRTLWTRIFKNGECSITFSATALNLLPWKPLLARIFKPAENVSKCSVPKPNGLGTFSDHNNKKNRIPKMVVSDVQLYSKIHQLTKNECYT